jgi:hypothetical protein
VNDHPKPISGAAARARLSQVTGIARDLGFAGDIEYRHLYSQSGGAQYCVGPCVDDDILVVYAEAFERDADPEDFSLDALIAHECGHQKLTREPELNKVLRTLPNDEFEEILASLVGSILLEPSVAAQTLVWKATAELGDMGISAENAARTVERLRAILRQYL